MFESFLCGITWLYERLTLDSRPIVFVLIGVVALYFIVSFWRGYSVGAAGDTFLYENGRDAWEDRRSQ